MNELLQSMLSHRSIRAYQDKPVAEEQLDLIIAAVQSAPSWINGQQTTVIAVKDAERKQQFAELCGGQAQVAEAPVFLVFCADFYRAYLAGEMEGQPMQAVSSDIDPLIVGVTDVGIALGAAVAAAEALGLGTVAIGGIRRNTKRAAELLELPPYVMPIVGLCIGHPREDPGLKPRLPRAAVYHEETYNKDLRPLLEQYNETYSQYLRDRTGGKRSDRWTAVVAAFYKNRQYYPGVEDTLRQQKFYTGR